jgi:hypothetical protein
MVALVAVEIITAQEQELPTQAVVVVLIESRQAELGVQELSF